MPGFYSSAFRFASNMWSICRTVGGAASLGGEGSFGISLSGVQGAWQYLAHWLARLRTLHFTQRLSVFSILSAVSIFFEICSFWCLSRFSVSSVSSVSLRLSFRPGTGKTHALCAVGHRLVEAGRSVLFAPAYRLVQDLLAAKRDLSLPRQLRKLDNYDFLLLDDLGYLPQGAEESEVLFTLIAERYERRSLGITSNLVFSQWEHIFANPMATAAAIDRVVHHSVILEFDVPSYRTGVAQQRSQEREVNRQE